MSSFEEIFEGMIRRVVREELQAYPREDRLLTAEQVAEILSYTNVESVRRLARDGHLEAINLGNNTRRYRSSDVQRLVQQGIV